MEQFIKEGGKFYKKEEITKSEMLDDLNRNIAFLEQEIVLLGGQVQILKDKKTSLLNLN